jgi:hypothetical protein
VLDVGVTEIVLDDPRVPALVGELELEESRLRDWPIAFLSKYI